MIQEIKNAIKEAFASEFDHQLTDDEIKIENTNPQFEGSFTFVVFPYLRVTRKKPEETAEIVGTFVKERVPEIASFNVVKGFLNFALTDASWIAVMADLLDQSELGSKTTSPQKVLVEYSSPNTNKPLHLGHVRNNLLGYSIAQILAYAGHEVNKVNLINDRGIHICKSMLAYQKLANNETPESAGIKGDHLIGKYYVEFDKAHKSELSDLMANGKTEEEAKASSRWMKEAREMLNKWENGDEEIMKLWNQLNNWVYEGFDVTYNRMGVDFNTFYKESDTYLLGKEMVQKGLKDGLFFQKDDGSVWIDLTDEGLDEKLLLRGDGTSVYMTQDMGTCELKYQDYGMDKSMYVVGNEQDYHFKVLKLIMQKMGKTYADGIFHMSYGMVELPEGKMKTREGKVVDADDLMDEMHATAKQRTLEQGKTEGLSDTELEALYETLGLGALKYFLLKVDPTKRIVFNPEESIDFQGNTGTFIQYTYARCQSILRNWSEETSLDVAIALEDSERDLIAHFFQFDSKLEEACRLYSPATVAQYLYETAKLYNSFYNQCSILKAETQEIKHLRIALTQMTARMLKLCGELLGMKMPNKM